MIARLREYGRAARARWRAGAAGPPMLSADEARRRRREAVVIGVTAIVLVAFAIFETRLPHFSDSASVSGNIIFFLLINLNLILLVLMIFLVTRNLIKLVFERRQRILGSRLRSRLVLAFVGLSLFPTLLLFLVAQAFLSTAIGNWFGGRFESSLVGALHVAHSFYQQAGNDALADAGQLSTLIQTRGLTAPNRRAVLQELIDAKRGEWSLAGIEVYVGGQPAAAAWRDDLAGGVGPPPAAELAAIAETGQEFVYTQRHHTGEVIRAGIPVRDAHGQVTAAVVIDAVVPRSVSVAAKRIARSFQDHRQLKVLKQPIKNGYLLTFFLVTLVVIFSATWLGFYLAKTITVPIQRLGEGMREVAHGNWDYRAARGGDEEVATLVDSFNQMATDLKAIHSALEERRRYIENVLANVTAGVVSIDEHGVIATVNPAAGEMLEVEPEELRGVTWLEAFRRPDLKPIGEVIARVNVSQGDRFERQIELVSGGARPRTVLATVTTLAGESGLSHGVILFLEDVTHLLRVERMEAWREVARRIAHEIKNPLTPIQLNAHRLRKRYGAVLGATDDGLLDECTTSIIAQVEELKRLVNEFSTFARLPAAQLAPNDLNEVAEEALVLFREAHREIGFSFQPDAAVPMLDLDRDAIKRAIINMLDNAVAACRSLPAGSAHVELRTEHDPRAGIVRLEVADNGSGMPPEVKARAFEPYFSTKKDGTGLGLAIVSSIAAEHQAYVRVRDNQPRGTRIVIELPLRRLTARAAGARA